jgi:hypothetical protein
MIDWIDRISGETSSITMPQAALHLPHRVRLGVETIDEIFTNPLFNMVTDRNVVS